MRSSTAHFTRTTFKSSLFAFEQGLNNRTPTRQQKTKRLTALNDYKITGGSVTPKKTKLRPPGDHQKLTFADQWLPYTTRLLPAMRLHTLIIYARAYSVTLVGVREGVSCPFVLPVVALLLDETVLVDWTGL